MKPTEPLPAGLAEVQRRFLQVAFATLANRALLWVVVLMAAGLWWYAAWRPEIGRIGAAAGYCILVLIPMLIREAREGGSS